MDDPPKHLLVTSEDQNSLPDVVHSQQIPAVGTIVSDQNDTSEADTGRNSAIGESHQGSVLEDDSNTESISEHIPSKMEYSVTESDNLDDQQLELIEKEEEQDKIQLLNIPIIQSPASDNPSTHDPSKLCTSWPIDVNAASEIHRISEESPVNLTLPSDTSRRSDEPEKTKPNYDINSETSLSTKSDNYVDSLNSETSNKSFTVDSVNSLEISGASNVECENVSSGSEEIIKLDIRGQGAPKFQSSAKIIFGPPPEGGTVIDVDTDPIPVFKNLLSPFLVGAGDGNMDELYQIDQSNAAVSNEVSPEETGTEKFEQSDLLVEEVTVDNELKEKELDTDKDESLPIQPKSLAAEETMSFSTLTTDYKTICEEYQVKLVHLEDAITRRDGLIEELTVSLQRSVSERNNLKFDNDHLTNEVQNLQHLIAEQSLSEHDTIKAQLSDFAKYRSFIKDDSTRYYSALMSGGSSLHSSNGEKDMDREEITVNYSRSDLKSSGSSDDFNTAFETKIRNVMSKFDEFIAENMRNKLRESLIQVLCDEIGRMRIESDTEVKELEGRIHQNKAEMQKLREMLCSVKTGDVNIDELRQELSKKHEKEMDNLRMFFEKKCSDMERSYSEEVWRGKVCASPTGSASSLDAHTDAAGDYLRRTKSADLPSLTQELSQGDQPLKYNKKMEQQLEEMRAEHDIYVKNMQEKHREKIAVMEEQITQLKNHIQTSENAEANVSLYQQDIDLELEKKRMEEEFERRLDEAKKEIVQEIQEQLQVLLSDPDAEVSNWPLELVALRDKIHGDSKIQEKELPGLREDASAGGEADRWKQRRNNSFDQNRQLEEVTKERDGFKRVAATLQQTVGQLVAYCATAEDELNRTVLAQLLARLLHSESFTDEESRPSTPNTTDLNLSLVSNSKHVHFAPDITSILSDIDEEGIEGFLQHQRDLSADIKQSLEHSLRRLRNEAHDLLDLSARLSCKSRRESNMLESSQVEISELVEELDRKTCDECAQHRRNMEEEMAECLQRESLLRADLEGAMLKIAALMTNETQHEDDIVAEGYGTALPQSCRPRRVPPDAAMSLDGCHSPRNVISRLSHDIDALHKERDDLQQQLEAANRQLRSTRQFVEEQATERESERDEYSRELAELREENTRLVARLQNNARILNEIRALRLNPCTWDPHDANVEQLEAQTREMNQIIAELETRKASSDGEVKSMEDKITLLRDIIAELENKLEQKTLHENEVLKQLEVMKQTIDERDSKMRAVLGELESMKSERAEDSQVMCVKCGLEEDRYNELLGKVKQQSRWLEEKINRRTRKLERIHDAGSTTCSEPSEDVSLREQKNMLLQMNSPESEASPRREGLPELEGVLECIESLCRAEDAAVKRIADLDMQRAQLMDVAQEVRAERDVLQARMSEQALKISSLSARLQQQRNDAEAVAHQTASELSVRLHDALAEVQRLKEELESKDKQLLRAKQNSDEREKLGEHPPIYGNSCNPKDKVIILERELSSAQTRIAQLECLAKSLEEDKERLHTNKREMERALAEREEQLHEILALKLDEDQKEEKEEIVEGAKTSARTLSDIVSISDFDEQDIQMRRAELKSHHVSLSNAPFETRDKSPNRTLPPELQRPNMSSLNVEYTDHFDLHSYSPRADSLPTHLTSTQNKDLLKHYRRNANETAVFGTIDKFGDSVKHSTAQKIADNCSMYPNRDVSESKNISVEPKKINFSLEVTKDNRTYEEEFTSLRELGITLDIRQENFPDILSQLKHEIKKSRSELNNCKSELKHAEEQLCEFPALKEEVEELKTILENTMATMETDKKFYENQLESFSSSKTLLEQRLTELTQDVNDKTKDLHLLKEDILRRENMILELAKEKRNLTNKLTELEVKIDELQSRNSVLEKFETENHQMKEKIDELKKLEQLVSEKNQQIDSLNQHLDRLDDLQRCLNDKTEELEQLKEAFEEKSSELFQMQDTVEALNRDTASINEENAKLNVKNKDLTQRLTKMEKEQENASIKLQNSESELERVNSLNSELTSKIDELKSLTDKLKDKETEIEILNEDINYFHEEIASLKEQLKMVSRSPSPRKTGEDKKSADRQASGDKKQLVKIRKQISLLQHELDFNKKELNDKAFELAKAKLDITELRSNLSQAAKQTADRDVANNALRETKERLQHEIQELKGERETLKGQLEMVMARIREESNVSELKAKLRAKSDRCQELEAELQDLRELTDSVGSEQQVAVLPPRAPRSPTAELERALRDQLDYSHSLDEDILHQIISASSDEHEDIPRLALNTSKSSSSSIHSSSAERLNRLRMENDKLLMQVNNLELRLKDKDALIAELNRVRDKLVQDWQSVKMKYEAERENAGRLQLLLDTHKDTAQSLQNQDSSMIQILKKRLESSMQSELELQQREQAARSRASQLERRLVTGDETSQHDVTEALRGEISLVKSKLELERTRYSDLQATLEHCKLQMQREMDAKAELCQDLRTQLAESKRLKHEAGLELIRAKELLNVQSNTISELENRLASTPRKQKPIDVTLTEIEGHKSELAREISTLKKCLADCSMPELNSLRQDKQKLTTKVEALETERGVMMNRIQGLEAEKVALVNNFSYLHGRCLRLESCRKALVWQKRYLQRVNSGYVELEKNLCPQLPVNQNSTGKKRFKCVATAVIIVLRMGYLVRRRQISRHAAAALTPTLTHRTTSSQVNTPVARRILKQDLRLQLHSSPTLGDFVRRSPCVNSPRDEPFILSSPRGEVAAAYLNKLELVSRCLNQAMDASREVP